MKLRAVALSVIMVVSVMTAGVVLEAGTVGAANSPADLTASDLPGDGTASNPYQISNASELQAMEDDLGANYTLVSNVDASDTSEWNGGAGFAPIGDSSNKFTGTLDGNGYTIANLTINRSSENRVGLFGSTESSAEIANASLEDSDVTGFQYVGGLVGYSSGTVDSSYATGNVSATGNTVGGLVGYSSGTVDSSYATGNVSATDNMVGGLIGTNFGTVDSSYATGTVTGQDRVGGLIGANSGTVTDAYWDVNTTGQSDTNDGSDDAGTGLTTSQLKANTNLAFDFTNMWDVRTGGEVSYPYLLNNTQSPAPGLETLYAGGNGTTSDPYEIRNWTHLDNVRENLGANYRLVADLNASTAGYDSVANASANGDKGFDPIGDSSNKFTGTFDGNDSTIADLTINRSSEKYVGLFGYTGSGAEIVNATVEDINITGEQHVGGLVGDNYGRVTKSSISGNLTGNPIGVDVGGTGGLVGTNNGSVELSSSAANVTASSIAGGLVGKNKGTVEDTSTSGTVNGSILVGGLVGMNKNTVVRSNTTATVVGRQFVGGLVGMQFGSVLVEASNASGAVTGNHDVGGLVGANGWESQSAPGGTIENSTASGTVTVDESATAPTQFGGLVGQSFQGTVTQSNATGDVNGGDATNVGGLVGYNDATEPSTIRETYATGAVDGGQNVGGLVGKNVNALVTDSYAMGSVNGSSTVGGLVGNNTVTDGGQSVINNSYAAGAVSGNASGGLVGTNSGTVTDAYWDTETTNQTSSAGGTGLTTSQLKANTSLAFDFPNTWGVVDNATHISYPYLVDTTQSPAPGLQAPISDFVDLAPSDLPGSGTSTDPYQISNASEMQAMADNLTAHYELTKNIDASSTSDWRPKHNHTVTRENPSSVEGFESGTVLDLEMPIRTVKNVTANGSAVEFTPTNASAGLIELDESTFTNTTVTFEGAAGFEPVGNLTTPFTGSFDANGHTISNLMVQRPGETNVGLFGVVGSNGTITDTSLQNIDVTGQVNVGGLVGNNTQGTITGADTTGVVTARKAVGGLVGWNFGGKITSAHANATVRGAIGVGGLAGATADGGTIQDSSAEGDVIGITAFGKLSNYGLGGFVGTNGMPPSGTDGMLGTYIGEIDRPSYAGSTISNSTASADVSVPERVDNSGGFDPSSAGIGGFAGLNWDGTIRTSTATGTVSSNDVTVLAGGFLGANAGTVNHSSTTSDVDQPNSSVVGGHSGASVGRLIDASASGDVYGNLFVGGLVGFASDYDGDTDKVVNNNVIAFADSAIPDIDAVIRGSSASGNVTGGDGVGGLVGANGFTRPDAPPMKGTLIEDSTASGDVTSVDVGSSQKMFGGLVGLNALATITTSNATGDVNAPAVSKVGGLLGMDMGTGSSISVNESYASGSVQGDKQVGGLIGATQNSILTDTYAVGNVKGNSSVGGLVGAFAGLDAVVNHSYAVGLVDSAPSGSVGGLIGTKGSDATVEDAYWDINATGQNTSPGNAKGLTTAEMTGDAAKNNMSVLFDFENTWFVISGEGTYPLLSTNSEVVGKSPPTADAGADATIYRGSSLALDGSGSSDNYRIASYEWTLPDGETMTGVSPERTFSTPGTYTVTLTVTDAGGNTDSDSVTVTVEDAHVSFLGGPENRGYYPNQSGPTSHPVEAWNASVKSPSGQPALVGDTLYVGGANLFAYNSSDGSRQWSFSTRDITGSPSVANGVVYAGDDAGKLYAVDAENGSELWRETFRKEPIYSPVVTDGVVYTANRSTLFALNASTGTELWNYSSEESIRSPPIVDGDTVYTSDGSNFTALDVSTGAVQWTEQLGFIGTITSDEDAVFVGAASTVTALDPATGDVRWNYTMNRGIQGLTATGDTVVAVDGGVTSMVALNDSTASMSDAERVRWNNSHTWGQPIVADGIVYAVNVTNYSAPSLHALDATTGDELWSDANRTYGPLVPLVWDGTLYVSSDRTLHALQAPVSTSPEPANFDVSIDTPATIKAGNTLTVDTTIDNIGDESGSQTILFTVNSSQYDAKTVNLDGGTSKSIEFTYPTEADDVGELAVGAESEDDAASSTVTVDETRAPTADAGSNQTVSVSETVTFDGTNSTDDIGITSYEWDFDDGTTATGPTPKQTYDSPGTYTVTLTVTNDAGNTDTDTATVTVQDTTAPTANAGSNQLVDEDTQVSFDGTGSSDNVGVTSYDWDFGDGSTVTAAAPTHTYADPGTYLVTLTVTDDAENKDTDTITVRVADTTPPTAEAGPDKTVSAGTSVSFDGTNSTDNHGVTSYSWDFGDDSTKTGSTPTHTYDSPGIYTVTLTVTDDAGNNDTDTVTVTVEDRTMPSISAFTATNPSGRNVSVTFESSEPLSTIEVGISGAESATLGTVDFNQTANEDGTYRYTATYGGSTDGTYTATLENATDEAGNDGSNNQSDSVTVDTTAPSVAGFEATNPSDQDVQVSLDADEQLSEIAVSITGPESATLTTADFTETDNGDGTYTYVSTYQGSTDGNYTATLETATDNAGNDGANNQSASVSVDTVAPSIAAFEATNPSDQDVQVAFDAGEQLSQIEVAITGPESATLTTADFTETDNGDGTYTYTAIYQGSTDGTYTATLQTATDNAGNDGANNQSASVSVDTVAPSIAAFEATNPSDQDVQVAFDADEQLSTIEVAITGAASATLSTADFTETDNGDGTYTYTATYQGSTDGTYTATLETATDDVGNDGASGQSATVEVDTADDGGGGGGSAPGDRTAPSVSGFDATNPSDKDVKVTFDANEQLTTIEVTISGAESATLGTVNFTEIDNGDGTYTYETTYAGSSDGRYTATLETAQDDAGNDGASGQSETVTLDTTAPSVSGFDATNPSAQDVRVSFDADEQLSTIEVVIGGAESATLSAGDFTETDNGDGTYTYETTYAGSSDGTYTATLETATDDVGNDGASGQSETVTLDTIAPSVSGFETTNPSGQDVQVSFSADEQLSSIEVTITGAESATLNAGDFTETDNGDGTYTYETTYVGSSDGTYTATLETAQDEAGNDGASGQSDGVTIDTADEGDDGEDGTDEGDDGEDGTDEGEDTDDSDDDDTDEKKPSGETTGDEEWVEPSEIEDVEIIDVRLKTEPANSVKTTSIVTLDNPAEIDQTVEIRFVIDGKVVEEREVSVPAESRMNATHSEIVDEPGTHEVAANIAMETEDGGIVRTFDFRIGTVELNENGNEIASSSADPPSIDGEEEVATGDSDDGLGTEVFVGIGFVALALLLLVGLYWRRRSGSSSSDRGS